LLGQFCFHPGVVRESGNLLRQQNGNIRGCDAGLDEFIRGGFGDLAASVQRKDGRCLGHGGSPLRQRISLAWPWTRGSDSTTRVLQ
jgi:hypothetical protein